MGCNARGGGHRKSRHSRKQQHHQSIAKSSTKAVIESNPKPTPETANSMINPGIFSGCGNSIGEGGGGFLTEDQLEDILLNTVDIIYKDVFAKLACMGYDEDVALNAVLHNGHCYGSMDVLTNIIHNALVYLNFTASADYDDGSDDECEGSTSVPEIPSAAEASSFDFAFSDLRHLQQYSIAGMICLIQEVRPHISRADAMWCLLMCDLNVNRAKTFCVPTCQSPVVPLSSSAPPLAPDGDSGSAIPYNPCIFHGDCNGEDGLSECSKQFNLPASVRSFFTRNASMSVPGIPSNQKLSLPAPRVLQDVCGSPSSSFDHLSLQKKQNEDGVDGKREYDVVTSVLKALEKLTLEDEKIEDETQDTKKEMIMGLVNQIRNLEEQVNERKEWAQQKAMQAAQKLSSDLNELRILRMEREANQRMKKGKQTLEDSTMKQLSEMENALRKASGQVDRANAIVNQLEAENAEIKAEMEASKLSAAESVKACLELTKKEKKSIKRLQAWEKQKEKLQEQIAEEKKRCVQMQETLNQFKEAQKEAEAKWKQEVMAREEAVALVEEERRAREAVEANVKRRHEVLRQKIEIDFQRHKDDIQRLERELSRLRSSADSTQSNSVSLSIGGVKTATQKQGPSAKTSLGPHRPKESPQKPASYGRRCIFCKKNAVSVVFLPCTHQVLCISCNEDHEKRAKSCPCCSTRIQERIRVYGASS